MNLIRYFSVRLKRVWGQSIRRQITLSFSAASIAIFLGLGYFFYSYQQNDLYAQGTARTFRLAQMLALSSAPNILSDNLASLDEIMKDAKQDADTRAATVLSPQGNVLSSTNSEYTGKHFNDASSKHWRLEPQILRDNSDLIEVVVPILVANRHIGWVRVERSRDSDNRNLHHIVIAGAVSAFLMLMMITLVATLLAKRLTRGLDRLAKVASDTIGNKPFKRLDIERADEIGILARHLYGMLDTIDKEKKENIISNERLRRESEKNLALLHNASDGIHILDYDGNIIEASDSFCAMLGYRRDEVIGMNVSRWDAGLKGAELAEVVRQLYAIQGRSQFETRHRRKDGAVIDVEASSFPLELGGKPALFCSSRDITERKRVADVVRGERNFIRAVLNTAAVLIVVINREGEIVRFNRAAEEFTGYTFEEVKDRPFFWDRFLLPEQREGVRAIFEGIKLGKVTPYNENHWLSRDGKRRLFAWSNSLLADDKGQMEFIIAFGLDITDQKKTENALRESEAHLRIMLENDLVGIAIVKDRILQWVNPAYEKLLGYEKGELSGVPARVLYVNDDAYHALGEKYIPAINAGKVFHTEQEFLRKDGSLITVDLNGGVLNQETGESLWVYVDITERKRVENALSQSESSLRTLIHTIPDLIWMKDSEGVYLSCNHRFEKFFGAAEKDIVGRTDYDFVGKELADSFREHDCIAMIKGCPSVNEEWVTFADDGHLELLETTKTPVLDTQGKLVGILGIGHDITSRKQMEEQVQHLAFHDTLTQLPNRRLLNDRLGQTLAASKRSGRYGALMFLDLDNFKPLNDTHGHGVGDLLLIEAARRINSCVREVDTVARLGGDEFVVMLSELDEDKGESTTQASIVAEKIRASLAEPYLLAIQQEDKTEATVEHHCTSSIGVVLFFNHDASPEDILKWADMAMYQAKEAGRNLVRFFDSRDGSAVPKVDHDVVMLRLAWHTSYDCGEPTIDHEHRRLFDLANTLIETALTRKENPERFVSALEKLLAHIVSHFAEEEAILARHGYADLESHAQAHKVLIEHALRLRDEAAKGGVTLGELVSFLADEVVTQHMLKADSKFYPLF